MTIAWSIAAFIVAIGILVTVHEAGHFLVARWCGVRVLRFSVGFGTPLLRWHGRAPDRTEYVVAAIPLGGYVRMLDGREDDVAPEEQHRAFNQRPLGQRAAIVAAGPAANFLFAVVAYWAVAVIGTVELRPIIGEPPEQTPAAAAGLQAGDEILAVDGRETLTWQRLAMTLLDVGFTRDDVPVAVEGEDGARRDHVLDLAAEPALRETTDILGTVGLRPYAPRILSTLGDVVDGGPADRAGLRAGDQVVAVDGEPVEEWPQLVERIEPRPGEEVTITYRRGARTYETVVVLERHQRGDREVGLLGVRPHIPEELRERMRREVRHGPVEGLWQGVSRTWDTTALTVKVLYRMVRGEATLQNIGGPVTIGQFAGDTAALGVVPFLAFLGIISISLGIVNLIPVPMLDGGHLLYFLYEAITGRPPSERAQAIGQRIGILALIGLMSLALYNDFHRLFG